MLEILTTLREMPRDLTDPYEQARALVFASGLNANDIIKLSIISKTTYYRIKTGGEAELRQSNQQTIARLARGYEELLKLTDKVN